MMALHQQPLVLSNLLVLQLLLSAAGSKLQVEVQPPADTLLFLGKMRALLQERIREAVLLHRPICGQWRCPAHLGIAAVSAPPTNPTAALQVLP
jgi:hypothetical protein